MAETLGRNFIPNHVCIHNVCLVLCTVCVSVCVYVCVCVSVCVFVQCLTSLVIYCNM